MRLVLLLLIVSQGFAQNSFWVASSDFHYGFIIPHHKFLRDISQSNPWGISLSFSKHIVNQQVWEVYGCFPRVGGQLNFFNFGNPAQLGSTVTALGFVEPFFGYGKLKPSLRLATGPAYMSVVYHPKKNPENQFVSSHLSFKISAQFTLSYSIKNHLFLRSSLTFNHISNGGIKEPNRGINFPTASIGIEYNFSKPDFPLYSRQRTVDELHPQRFSYEFAVYMSGKKLEAFAHRLPVYGAVATANYIVGKTSMLRGGFELCRDESLAKRVNNGEQHNPNTAALLFGHDYLMGRFRINTHLGAYLIKPNQAQMLVYQRYGLDFRFWRGFYAGMNLKSHTFTADFMDFRLGIRI